MKDPRNIQIKDYTYQLPPEKIASHPHGNRGDSKLLIYKAGKLTEDVFHNLSSYLPHSSLLVFNNSRVINARFHFQKPSGASIEILCLEPGEHIIDYSIVMNQKGNVKWKCLVGGVAKWKNEILEKSCMIDGREVQLNATKIKMDDTFMIQFSWSPSDLTFGSILKSMGDVPLPPYIKRKPEKKDEERYQTIYAKENGSVAAPTAGLHFTKDILKKLEGENIGTAFITLHIGAGTFLPVKSSNMEDHIMHSEVINIDIDLITKLLEPRIVTAVGTTSLRTLESIYWLGVKTILDPGIKELQLLQWEIYDDPLLTTTIEAEEALISLISWMRNNNQVQLFSQTQLLIVPGYRFRIVKVLITNFHQPESTLLLIVAAAIGKSWRKMYDYALANDFRFLSYGDGNLIFMGE